MKIEKVPKDDFDVHVTLSKEEATIIYTVFGKIGGYNSLRIKCNDIHKLFDSIGLKHEEDWFFGSLNVK